jgi:hypothetical protein
VLSGINPLTYRFPVSVWGDQADIIMAGAFNADKLFWRRGLVEEQTT